MPTRGVFHGLEPLKKRMICCTSILKVRSLFCWPRIIWQLHHSLTFHTNLYLTALYNVLVRAYARVQSFYVFAFTSSPFGCKVLSKCELRVKVSPFCLHLFLAIGVVQGIEIQLVAVKVKVNTGFAFTFNRLIHSLLHGKVKGEGKNGKFAESASAYIRVGACPARRSEGEFVRGREVWDKTREEVAKSGDVWRESRLVFFEWSGGGEEKQFVLLGCPLAFPWWPFVFRSRLSCFNTIFPILILRSGILGIFPSSFFVGRFFFFCSVLVSSHSPLYFLSRSPFFKEICPFSSRFVCLRERKTPAFLFSTSAKVVFGTNCKQKYPVKLIFSAKTEISGENFSRAEEKNTPQKVDFFPKVAGSDEKGRFWGENHREGMKRKNGRNSRFCHAMK